MKVIVINGSPKGERSNSMRLTRAFLEGAGWAGAEIIDAAKANVKGCMGCYSCWTKTPGKCVIDDDMSAILPKVIAADAIVWSFPLYCYSVPGGLKHFLDRNLPLALPFMDTAAESGEHPPRYDLSRQKHILVSTCGFWTTEGNYDGVNFMFDRGGSPTEKIYCAQGELFGDRVPEPRVKARAAEYLETVKRAGAEYAAGGISAETRAELSRTLFPREEFEKGADASWKIEQGAGG